MHPSDDERLSFLHTENGAHFLMLQKALRHAATDGHEGRLLPEHLLEEAEQSQAERDDENVQPFLLHSLHSLLCIL